MSKKFHVRRLEAMKILAIADRTFARLEADGVLVALSRSRGRNPSTYDLRTIVPAYVAYVQKTGRIDDRQARARRDNSLAHLNELRLKERLGELAPRAQFIAEGQAYSKTIASMIRATPRRLHQAGIVDLETEGKIAGFLRDLLVEISSWKTLDDVLAAEELANAHGPGGRS